MVGCAYGASVKAGVNPAAEIIIDRSTWATMVGASSTWFDQWLAFLQPKAVKVSDLVALNPDDPPLPSPADLIAAVTPPYLGIPSILNYMWAKLSYYEFTQVGVCNASPTTCNTQQMSAGGWTDGGCSTGVESEGFKFTALVNQCRGGWLYTGSGHVGGWIGQNISIWSVTSGTKIAGPQTVLTPGGINSVVYFTWTSPVTLTPNQDYIICIEKANVNCYAFKTSGFPSATGYYTGLTGLYSTGTSTIPSTPLGAMPGVEPELCGSTTPSIPPSSSPSQPTTVVTAPTLSCGTTADLCTAVRQLDQRLTQIYALLTATQRMGVPYAYIPGAVHSGLTGTGSFVISQLLGARVQLSSINADVAPLPGNPPYLWDQGWLSVNDSNGMLEEKRLTRTGMEWFPRFCQMATSFNYDLADNVVMNMTELYAEP